MGHAQFPDPIAPDDFEIVRRAPAPALSGLVRGLTFYREQRAGHFRQLEPASLTVPLVISFGDAFAIGLGRQPGGNDRYLSFAAGLFAGPVIIDSFGGSNCLQVDFTPLGARRFFRLPMRELTDRMVGIDDVLGRAGLELREQLGAEPDCGRRFDLAESFILTRLAEAPAPSGEVEWAFGRIVATGGCARIGAVARSVGWSRKHLNRRFSEEVGLGPKTVARIMRFNRAFAASRSDVNGGWAGIAADCGYADQAHLVREFREFSGASPRGLAGNIHTLTR